MLEQTYMDPGRKRDVTSSSKRRTVHLKDDVFARLDQYVATHGDSKNSIVSKAVMDLVSGQREQFLKMYAPHLTLEHSTSNTIFIQDQDLEKTAVVKAKWNNITKEQTRSLLSLHCELCDSEHCIHVRFSLVIPDIVRIKKEGKLV